MKQAHIQRIAENLAEVLRRADECHQPTQAIAEELAGEYLRKKPVDPVALARVG